METNTSQPNQQNVNNNLQIPLPYSAGVLVMGIISIALCSCFGIVGITLGIISIVLGNKANKLYKESPEKYTIESYKNNRAGYICAIIGLSLSSLYLLSFIIYILFISTITSIIYSSFL